MALIRPVPTDHGGVVEYWRIEEIHDDIAACHLKFTLRGYVNEAARRSGKQFVYEYPLEMTKEKYRAAPGLAFLYEGVKAMPHFSTAQDG